jgi:hypothetical protein
VPSRLKSARKVVGLSPPTKGDFRGTAIIDFTLYEPDPALWVDFRVRRPKHE